MYSFQYLLPGEVSYLRLIIDVYNIHVLISALQDRQVEDMEELVEEGVVSEKH